MSHIDGIYCDSNNLIRNLVKYSKPLKKRCNYKINLKTKKYDVRFKNNLANEIFDIKISYLVKFFGY